jgi:hypothetical protein
VFIKELLFVQFYLFILGYICVVLVITIIFKDRTVELHSVSLLDTDCNGS